MPGIGSQSGGAINIGQPVNQQAPLNRSLVGWWMSINKGAYFGGGNLLNLLGRNHGQLVNGPAWSGQARMRGYGSLNFNGTNSYLECGTSGELQLAGPMTAAAWINHATLANFGTILGTDTLTTNSQQYVLEVGRTSGKVSVIWNNTVIATSTGSYSAGVWTHVAFVRRGSTGSWSADLFINGVKDSTTAASQNPTAVDTANTHFWIGARAAGASRVMNGLLDDLRLWNRDLAVEEMQLLYNASRTGYLNELNWVRRGVGYAPAAGGGGLSRLVNGGLVNFGLVNGGLVAA